MFNIAVFDDQGFVVDAIVKHFIAKPKVGHIKGFTHADLLKNYVNETEVDVVISDVLTDEDLGLSVFEYLYKNHPKTRVIVYSSISSEFVKKCLMDIGVSHFVHKKENLDTLYEKVITSLTREKQVNKVIEITALTTKEKVIVEYLAQGLSAKEIADITGNSVNTINNQKNELLKKFESNNSTELVIKLGQLGLITLI